MWHIKCYVWIVPLENNLSSSKFDIDGLLVTGFGIFVISQILFLLKAVKEKETMSNTIEGKIQFWNNFKVFTINSYHNFLYTVAARFKTLRGVPNLKVLYRFKNN